MNVFWRPIAAIGILGAFTAGPPVYGLITAPERVSPLVRDGLAAHRSVDLAVVFDFKPESFHIKYLQAEGVVSRVEGNIVQVRRVEERGLSRLARQYWIRRIELLGAPRG